MTKNKSEKKSNKPGKKKSSSKGENKRMKKEAMINAIINVFKSSPKEPFNYRQISSMIGVTNQVQKLQVVDILYDLSSDNFISEIDRGRYRYNDCGPFVDGWARGAGRVHCRGRRLREGDAGGLARLVPGVPEVGG